jgi:hypothetical protein
VALRGRNAASRAEACWLPIAPGLTPHGLRHTYKTLMVELGTPPTLMDDQMGHSDGSVQARYAHATDDMVRRLLGGLTAVWEYALESRRQLSPGSPVAVLDAPLRNKIVSQDSPEEVLETGKAGPVAVRRRPCRSLPSWSLSRCPCEGCMTADHPSSYRPQHRRPDMRNHTDPSAVTRRSFDHAVRCTSEVPPW